MKKQLETMKAALIDLTQSEHEETARRARSALFDAGALDEEDGWPDGGRAECKRMYDKQRKSLFMRQCSDREISDIAADPDHPLHDAGVDEQDYRDSIASDPRIAEAMGEAAH